MECASPLNFYTAPSLATCSSKFSVTVAFVIISICVAVEVRVWLDRVMDIAIHSTVRAWFVNLHLRRLFPPEPPVAAKTYSYFVQLLLLRRQRILTADPLPAVDPELLQLPLVSGNIFLSINGG